MEGNGTAEADFEATEQAEALIRQYWQESLEANERGGMGMDQARERMRRYFHPEIRYECMGRFPFAGVYHGPEAVITGFLSQTMPRLSGVKIEVLDIFGEGNKVCMRSQIEATGPTGLRYNNRYCFVYTVRDNKIAEVLEYLDAELTHTAMFGMEDPCRDGHTCLTSLDRAEDGER